MPDIKEAIIKREPILFAATRNYKSIFVVKGWGVFL